MAVAALAAVDRVEAVLGSRPRPARRRRRSARRCRARGSSARRAGTGRRRGHLPTPSASLPFWICAEIAKARKLSRIQASAAIPTHFRARRHQGRSSGVFSGFGGSSEPSPRLQLVRAGRRGPACGSDRAGAAATGRRCTRAARRSAASGVHPPGRPSAINTPCPARSPACEHRFEGGDRRRPRRDEDGRGRRRRPAGRSIWRSTETSAGLTLDELLDTLERELRSALDAHPGRGGDRPRGPVHDRPRARARDHLGEPADRRRPDPRPDRRAARAARPSSTTTPTSRRSPSTASAPAADTRNLVLLTIGTGIGGGLVLEGEVYRGSTGAGAELGHVVIDENGPRCQGNCPNHGCVEALASGTALGRAGDAGGPDAPRLGARHARSPPTGRSPGRPSPRRRSPATGSRWRSWRGIGRHLGVALASFANIFDPDVIVIGGGVAAAGELLLEPARREVRAPGAAADERGQGRARGARPRRGDDRRRGDGARGGGSRAAGRAELSRLARTERGFRVPGRLTVCPTPIGNLEDLSPRARRALEEADLVACEDTRRAGRLYERLDLRRPRLVSYHEQNEAERARQLVAEIERGGEGGPDLRRRHAGDLRPRLPADPRLPRARPGGRGAPGAVGGDHRAGRLGAARRPLALRGLSAAPRPASSSAC